LEFKNEIVLTTINAKWIHPSLALRLLKANLGDLEKTCEIIEFALRQPLCEKVEPLLSAGPRILGISVSIWNHTATIELLSSLEKQWTEKPVIVLGGPEVSHLPADAEIFKYADHVIRGEGEIAFRSLCERILQKESHTDTQIYRERKEIKCAYYLYTDEDVDKKLIYVESSRGCPFRCEFCLSAISDNKVHEFPLDEFLAEMDILINRGVKTFKFLDRSFNVNVDRSLKIIEFFLERIEKIKESSAFFAPRNAGSMRLCENESRIPVVHFEMVPSIFPEKLRNALTRFPPDSLRLEIGIQTLNAEAAANIHRPSNPEKELEALRFLSEKTNAIIHADLIAGLPGEDLASFGSGFDRLWDAINAARKDQDDEIADNANRTRAPQRSSPRFEIQVGILKLLPGAPISHHNKKFGMRYNSSPPYEIIETSAMNTTDLRRIKNFARFWEVIVNRGLAEISEGCVFDKFMNVSDDLFACFGRNWGIDKNELKIMLKRYPYLVF